MKQIKLYYIIPILLSIVLAMVSTWLLIPQNLWIQVFCICVICLSVLGIGFRIVTYQRIGVIRNQLFQVLETLEEFDVDEPKKMQFIESSFPVFNELNEYLIELIDRVRTNYHANKQFTQNASHELQTPLAIIKGHIEILFQSPNIGEKEMKSLGILLQNTNRLSKLNSALILLSKIEHQRFNDTEIVDFGVVTAEILENFEDMIALQGLTIHQNNEALFTVEMSKTLAEIMIANLIQNAIRHNVKNGSITIDMTAEKYSIINTGQHLLVQPNNLFKRFKRESDIEESLGLGLSIIQRICEQSALGIHYQHNEGVHCLSVTHENQS